ncbi:MAG TPA: cytochrome P450 [Thermomicrobiales bacterium]|nr:cytochrome P450 [Thermomicrobiales bacterium]
MTATIDFSDPAIQADPYPVYRQLRTERPVCWNGQSWLVSRYDDVVGLLTDPRASSARTEAIYQALPPDVREELAPMRHVLGSRMLLSDPPRHTRLRGLVTQAFSAKMVEAKHPRIREIADALVARVAGRGALDVIADLATPLPGRVIADMLGVPAADQERFSRWSRDQVRVYDRPGTVHERVAIMRRGQASMLELRAYLEGVIAARRAAPRDDLVSTLVAAEEQGDRLSTDELVVMIIALLVGGNNSTAHLIGNAVLTLLRHPAALARLRAEPALVRPAIEEVLRFESPVQATSRVAREAIPLGGRTIAPGQGISLLFGAANRDPAQFADPDTFDLARQPNRHLTFAHGPHFCLGAALARAEAQAAVLALIARCPDLALATDRVEWLPGFSFRGLKALPVTCSAA